MKTSKTLFFLLGALLAALLIQDRSEKSSLRIKMLKMQL